MKRKQKERNSSKRKMLGRKEKVPVIQPSLSLPRMHKFKSSRRYNRLYDGS